MKPFVSNRFGDALIKTVLMFASIHIVALSIHAIWYLRLSSLNLFYILQLHLFFPEIVQGVGWFSVGVVVLILLYSIVYTFFTKPLK